MAKRDAGDGGKGRIARLGDLSSTLLELAGGWAESSDRLSDDEREELRRLRREAADPHTPLSGGERAKHASLVAKAIGADRLRELLGRRAPPPQVGPSPRAPSDLDAAARLERAARLRDAGVITEEDFATLKARYLEEL